MELSFLICEKKIECVTTLLTIYQYKCVFYLTFPKFEVTKIKNLAEFTEGLKNTTCKQCLEAEEFIHMYREFIPIAPLTMRDDHLAVSECGYKTNLAISYKKIRFNLIKKNYYMRQCSCSYQGLLLQVLYLGWVWGWKVAFYIT